LAEKTSWYFPSSPYGLDPVHRRVVRHRRDRLDLVGGDVLDPGQHAARDADRAPAVLAQEDPLEPLLCAGTITVSFSCFAFGAGPGGVRDDAGRSHRLRDLERAQADQRQDLQDLLEEALRVRLLRLRQPRLLGRVAVVEVAALGLLRPRMSAYSSQVTCARFRPLLPETNTTAQSQNSLAW
jgi:hypothetical protein